MAHGGARNRSGPQADETSARSDARGFKLTALPAAGFRGRVPKFPLPLAGERELEVWKAAWRTPQACAWNLPSERWRIPTVALWVRIKVRCEDPDATAAIVSSFLRLSDQIGMTTAGLAEMGWKVAVDEMAVARASQPVTAAATPPETPAPRPRRLRAVPSAQ